MLLISLDGRLVHGLSGLCSRRIRGISVSQRDAVLRWQFCFKRSPSCFFDDHVDIWGRARRHMHDRMYPFELGIISFDVILKCFGFARDPIIFPLEVDVDVAVKIVPPSLFC